MAEEEQTTEGEPQDPANPVGAGSGVVEGSEGEDGAPSMPDEAYKGIQRRLSAEQVRTQGLEAQIQELQRGQNGTVDPRTNTIVQGLIRAIGEQDQTKAAQLSSGWTLYQSQLQNEALTGQQQTAAHQSQVAELRERNMVELREVAKSLGADPDSPLMDYGTDSQTLADRIRAVRESALAATKVVEAKPKPQRSAGEGTAHVTQPGTPGTPTPKEQPATQDEFRAAVKAYTAHPCKEHETAMRELRDKLRSQAPAVLTA